MRRDLLLLGITVLCVVVDSIFSFNNVQINIEIPSPTLAISLGVKK
jgi:hypothetical protein